MPNQKYKLIGKKGSTIKCERFQIFQIFKQSLNIVQSQSKYIDSYNNMGKQQTNKAHQPNQQLQPNLQQPTQQKTQKKKIIKKFTPKIFTKKVEDIDKQLKNWKPTKLSEAKAKQIEKVAQKSNLGVAESFLNSIPEPTIAVQNQRFKPNFYATTIKRKPQIDLSKPTEDQIKWDLQQQSFINKHLQRPPEIQQKFKEPQEQQQLDQQIVILANQKNQKVPIKEVNISDTIQKAWNNSSSLDYKYQYFKQAADMYMDNTNKGTKQILSHLKQTAQRQQQLNKRQMDKQKMRNRYGW